MRRGRAVYRSGWAVVGLTLGMAMASQVAATQAEAVAPSMVFVGCEGETWDIFVWRQSDGAAVQLTHSPIDENGPRWSKDRKRLVYYTTEGKVYVLDVEKGQPQEVIVEDANSRKSSPCFSPDGKSIVCVRSKPGTVDDTEIAIIDLEAKTWRTLIDQPGLQADPDWSADGRFVVYASNHCTADWGQVIQELWVVRTDGGFCRQLLLTNSNCMRPRWSPDGKRIAFSSDKAGTFDIWVLSLEDWSLNQVTTDPGLETSPAWSPDGRQIAFISTRGGKMKIWIRDLEAGTLRPVEPFKDKTFACRDVDW